MSLMPRERHGRKCTYCARSPRDLEIARERTWSDFNAGGSRERARYGATTGKREKKKKEKRTERGSERTSAEAIISRSFRRSSVPLRRLLGYSFDRFEQTANNAEGRADARAFQDARDLTDDLFSRWAIKIYRSLAFGTAEIRHTLVM